MFHAPKSDLPAYSSYDGNPGVFSCTHRSMHDWSILHNCELCIVVIPLCIARIVGHWLSPDNKPVAMLHACAREGTHTQHVGGTTQQTQVQGESQCFELAVTLSKGHFYSNIVM